MWHECRPAVRSELRDQRVRQHTCRLGPIHVRYRKSPRAGHMQNRKTKTNTNPSPDPNRYRRRCPACPDPNARIQKFIHYMAIATFVIADLCDSGPYIGDALGNAL